MPEESRWSRVLETSQGSLALIRELALLAVLAVLIFNASLITPVLTKIGLALEEAGFTEINIGGIKQDLSRLREKIEDTGLNTQQAQESLNKAKDILEQINTAQLNANLAESVDEAISQISRSQDQLGLAKQQIAQVTSSPPSPGGTQTIEPSSPERADQWVVVIGADRTVEEAKNEVRRAASNGFDSTKILRRDDWYRTVISYPTEKEANAALPEISRLIRESSYVRNLTT